jgi:hypothetical protein
MPTSSGKRLVMAAAIVSAGIAPAIAGSAVASAAPSSPSAGLGNGTFLGVVDLTPTSNGETVTVQQGEDIVVNLDSASLKYAPVTDTEAAGRPVVVEDSNTDRGGDATASFRALTPGTATIDSTASARCTPNRACPEFVQRYSVLVDVAARK